MVKQTAQQTQERIIELLHSVKRDGMCKLVEHIGQTGFFESPTSTKFHGCYKGGLAAHSLRVFELLDELHAGLKLGEVSAPGQRPLKFDRSNLIVAALLHDVCKVGAYVGDKKPYKWNKQQPKGHGALSITRINAFISLDEIEVLMIKFHMGVYGLNEFYKKGDWQTGEYPLRGDHIACEGMDKEESKTFRYGKSMVNCWYHNPLCKLMYFCDEIATLEEKASE